MRGLCDIEVLQHHAAQHHPCDLQRGQHVTLRAAPLLHQRTGVRDGRGPPRLFTRGEAEPCGVRYFFTQLLPTVAISSTIALF